MERRNRKEARKLEEAAVEKRDKEAAVAIRKIKVKAVEDTPRKKFTPTPILAPSMEAKSVLHLSERGDLETVEDPGGKVLSVWTKIHQTSNGSDSAVAMEV